MPFHQYNTAFVFANVELAKWQEILAWEQSHGFTGQKSKIWASHEGEIYLHKLIREQKNDFIREIPSSEILRESINPEGLTSLALAVQVKNNDFVRLTKQHLCNKNEKLENFSSESMRRLFVLFPDEPAKKIDLYTWAKLRKTNTDIMSCLYEMGAPLFSTLSNDNLRNDFEVLYPHHHSHEAPYSSPALFRAAMTVTGKLPGSPAYWEKLIKAAIKYRSEHPFYLKNLHALLNAVNSPEPIKEPDELYYAGIDQLIFLLNMQNSIAKLEDARNARTPGNLLRSGIVNIRKPKFHPTNASRAETTFLALVSIGIYAYLLSYLIPRYYHYTGIWNPLLEEIYSECDGEVNSCKPPISDWECCSQSSSAVLLNSTDWCDSWPDKYKACGQAQRDATGPTLALILYGVFGLVITPLSIIVATHILLAIFDVFLLKPVESLLGPAQFQSSNKLATLETIKALLKDLREKSPTFADQMNREQPGLLLIDKKVEEISLDEFLRAVHAIEECLGEYRLQINYLSEEERLSHTVIQSEIKTLSSFNIPSATRHPIRYTPSLTRRGIGSVNYEVDLENASFDTTALLSNERNTLK